jgi:hypothetical protein
MLLIRAWMRPGAPLVADRSLVKMTLKDLLAWEIGHGRWLF